MTREEAIRYLSVHSSTNGSGLCTDEQHYEAKQMAIKALEQEHCSDAISRTDAIRVASGYCHWSNISKELAKLPSVNPIPCEDAVSREFMYKLGAKCIAARNENGLTSVKKMVGNW